MGTQVTYDYTEKDATITYPDGSTESIRYIDKYYEHGGIAFYDAPEDSWEAYYSTVNEEPEIQYTHSPDGCTIISPDNYQKIEVDWTMDLTAVADVIVEEESRESRLFRSDKVEHSARIDDIEVWEALEWEVHNDE